MLFYLLTYAVTNLGAFGVIALLESADRPNDQRARLCRAWQRRIPALAALMTIFLLSLGGFPPMAGFIAKWYVFSAAIKAGYTWLAIIGVLTSVVSVFFYLRVVVMMYMTPTRLAARVPGGAAHRRRRTHRVRDPDLLSRDPAHAGARLGRGVGRAIFLGAVLRRRHVDSAAWPANLHRARWYRSDIGVDVHRHGPRSLSRRRQRAAIRKQP